MLVLSLVIHCLYSVYSFLIILFLCDFLSSSTMNRVLNTVVTIGDSVVPSPPSIIPPSPVKVSRGGAGIRLNYTSSSQVSRASTSLSGVMDSSEARAVPGRDGNSEPVIVPPERDMSGLLKEVYLVHSTATAGLFLISMFTIVNFLI